MRKEQNKNIGKNNPAAIYKNEDGTINLSVFIENETVWLTQKLLAELFDVGVPAVNKHLKNIFEEGELQENSVISILETTASDGKNYTTKYYNLDAIIAVGYRVNSKRATHFRIWATDKLKQYIIKGFAMNDERLTEGGARARYFEELLQRVRDIRSSERNFYQKVTDIYATSIDYKKDEQNTKLFFATVQNKMHFAVHEHTAAEIIYNRVNSNERNIGLTNFKGKYITEQDVKIAKNYLSELELKQLNLVVSLYLDFAELQASNSIPMTMKNWIQKLDEFLKLVGKKLLDNAGKISKEVADKKTQSEFEIHKKEENKKLVSDFDQEIKKLNSPNKS